MRASDIMTADPVTVSPDVPVRAAVAMLIEHGITSMPVVDDDHRIIGIVSEVDLLRGRLPHDPRAFVRSSDDGPDPARTVRDVMTDTVVCLPDYSDLSDLAEALVDDRVRAVPVLHEGELVGVVSRRDVLRTLVRDDAAITADARRRLDEFVPNTSWRVEAADGVVTATARAADEREERLVDSILHTIPGVVRVHVRTSRFAR